MNIFQVAGTIFCTNRHPDMGHLPLRILRDKKGNIQIAMDDIATRDGDWVYAVGGSAARQALGKERVHVITDLTICGIIDFWEEES